jgi:hypothetical protein
VGKVELDYSSEVVHVFHICRCTRMYGFIVVSVVTIMRDVFGSCLRF